MRWSPKAIWTWWPWPSWALPTPSPRWARPARPITFTNCFDLLTPSFSASTATGGPARRAQGARCGPALCQRHAQRQIPLPARRTRPGQLHPRIRQRSLCPLRGRRAAAEPLSHRGGQRRLRPGPGRRPCPHGQQCPPLWTALPDGALKRQLLGEIAELVQLDARDLSDLWSQEAARSGPARGSMAGGASHPGQQAGHAPAAPDWGQPVEYGAPSGWHERGGHGSGAGGWRSGEPGAAAKALAAQTLGQEWPGRLQPAPMGPRGAPATRTDQAARLLMAHMEFMEELTHEDFEALAHCSGEHGAMFRWMEAQFQESGARPFAVLREQLRGLPHETLADRLMSGPTRIPRANCPSCAVSCVMSSIAWSSSTSRPRSTKPCATWHGTPAPPSAIAISLPDSRPWKTRCALPLEIEVSRYNWGLSARATAAPPDRAP